MGKKSKDKRDIYYRKAKEEGWRARSAFKLIHIDMEYNIFEGVKKAVDLCAAPGSWSQVLSRKLYLGEDISASKNAAAKTDEAKQSAEYDNSNVKIVAVDLQPMAALPGVVQLQGDITQYSTAKKIIDQFDGERADLVICDGAPDVTGLHEMDMYIQSQLMLAGLHIACNVLKVNGNYVAKMFRSTQNDLLVSQYLKLFKDVQVFKPASSRNSSTEAFLIGLSYNPPADFDPKLITQYLGIQKQQFDHLNGVNRYVIPYIVCGDLDGYALYDSDATYKLQLDDEKKYEYREPVQAPLKRTYEELSKIIGKVDETSQIFNTDRGHLVLKKDDLPPERQEEVSPKTQPMKFSFNLDYEDPVLFESEINDDKPREHSYEELILGELLKDNFPYPDCISNDLSFCNKEVDVKLNMPEYTLHGKGTLIPEEVPVASQQGSSKDTCVLSVVDYYGFEKRGNDVDFFRKIKQALKDVADISCYEDAAQELIIETLSLDKHISIEFECKIPCTCGMCN